jgi:hypothetical protein
MNFSRFNEKPKFEKYFCKLLVGFLDSMCENLSTYVVGVDVVHFDGGHVGVDGVAALDNVVLGAALGLVAAVVLGGDRVGQVPWHHLLPVLVL